MQYAIRNNAIAIINNMEIGVPNSFIPHDATTPSASPRYDSSSGLTDLLTLVAVVLFIASAALAAGSFLYQQYLNSESTSKETQIQAAQAAFDPTLIQQFTALDDRMNAANTILGAHLAPSSFFAALDQTTLATVSFNNLELDAANPQDITLKMSGVARDINSIAYQADLFSKSGVITDPIFSGIDQQADGVHFDVTATINPTDLNYETLVSGAAPAGENQLPAGTQAPVAGASSGSTVISPFTGAPQAASTSQPSSSSPAAPSAAASGSSK